MVRTAAAGSPYVALPHGNEWSRWLQEKADHRHAPANEEDYSQCLSVKSARQGTPVCVWMASSTDGASRTCFARSAPRSLCAAPRTLWAAQWVTHWVASLVAPMAPAL